MDIQTPEQQAQQALIHRELYRKSRDLIRVYNPLDEDFRFKYDSFYHTVKAKQERDMERFLANHYFKAISQYIIGKMIQEKGEKMIADRETKGLPALVDNYDLQRQIWDYTPKMNDEKLLEQLSNEIIIGLVEEFGMDDAMREQTKGEVVDTRSAYEKVMDKMNKRVTETKKIPMSKAELAREVAK